MITIVASESTFSAGGRVIDPHCASLGTKMEYAYLRSLLVSLSLWTTQEEKQGNFLTKQYVEWSAYRGPF